MAVPLWLVFTLLSVVGKTAFYVFQKRLLEDESSLRTGYITAIYGLGLIIPLAVYHATTNGITATRTELLIILALGGVELVGFAVYLKALDLTDLSLAAPIKQSKPIGVALLEPILLGAVFSPILAAAGVLAGVGGYVVLMEDGDLFAPFRRITDPGPLLAFLAAGIYTILSLGSRFGNTATSPFIFGLIIFAVMTIGYTLILWRTDNLPDLREHFRREYVILGCLGFFRSFTVWMAYSMATATAVSTVTQLTILLDVLAGGALLEEGDTIKRLLGAVLILGGVLLAIGVV